MSRRLFRRIVFTLVTAQLLCAPPVTRALTALSGGAEAHCGEVMHSLNATDQGADDDCACCPERALSVAACLSACGATAGALPAFEFPVSPAAMVPARRDQRIPHALLADPPLDPPPIA